MNGLEIEQRYADMSRMRLREGASLREIAAKYGISRQRVQQIIGPTGHQVKRFRARKILAMPDFTNDYVADIMHLSESTVARYRSETGAFHAMKGHRNKVYLAAKELFNRMAEHGFVYILVRRRGVPTIIILRGKNRVSVGITVCARKQNYGVAKINPYYKFRCERRTDVLAAYAEDIDTFFLIPSVALPQHGKQIRIVFPPADVKRGRTVSKWIQYRENYGVLEKALG